MPDYKDILKKFAKIGMRTIIGGTPGAMIDMFSKPKPKAETESSYKDVPGYQFTKRHWVEPNKPGGLNPVERPQTPERPKREDLQKMKDSVEKANNDKNVIENYRNTVSYTHLTLPTKA